MKLEDFWALTQGSSTATNRQRERTQWLAGKLARLPVPAIVEFELHLAAQRKRADTWLMWGAAWITYERATGEEDGLDNALEDKVSTASAPPP